MTRPKTSHVEVETSHVEVRHEDDRTAAVAEVTTSAGPEGTVRTSLYAKGERVRRGDRTTLVDAVMELPEVQSSDRMEATVACGDFESVERLRERTDDPELRAAGSTTLLDANIPPQAGQPRDDQPPASFRY
jgi:hypothetical protein